MKLFIYDEKHSNVFGELELGELTQHEKDIISKIIDFLEEKNITDRYGNIVLANSYTPIYDEEFGGTVEIEFQ